MYIVVPSLWRWLQNLYRKFVQVIGLAKCVCGFNEVCFLVTFYKISYNSSWESYWPLTVSFLKIIPNLVKGRNFWQEFVLVVS
jgi:hypothetical protein